MTNGRPRQFPRPRCSPAASSSGEYIDVSLDYSAGGYGHVTPDLLEALDLLLGRRRHPPHPVLYGQGDGPSHRLLSTSAFATPANVVLRSYRGQSARVRVIETISFLT